MSEPFRTTLRPSMFRPRMPLWLARALAILGARDEWPDDGTGDAYEVTLARHGRPLEIVTVQARSPEQASARAKCYVLANIYPLHVRKAGEAACSVHGQNDRESKRVIHHRDGSPRNNDPSNLELRDAEGSAP